MDGSKRMVALIRTAALASLALASGCMTAASHDLAAQIRAVQPVLMKRADPDSLATAAFLARGAGGQPQDAMGLAARAAAAAPDRPDLAYVALALCYQAQSCDPLPIAAHLRDLDARNGITWLYALERASRSNDTTAMTAALAELAQAQRVDEYWTETVSHMSLALTAAGFDARSAFTTVIGSAAAQMTPGLQVIGTLCRQADLGAERLAQCRNIAAAFELGDTTLATSFGNRLAGRLWPAGSAPQAAIRQRRRTLDYQQQLWTDQSARLNSAAAIDALAAQYSHHHGEQAALRAWYGQQGISAEPPANWQARAPGA